MDIFRLTPAADGNVAWPTLSTSKKSVVTVGAFDGLHVGHHAVIEETVRQARKLDAYSVVIMFDPRPAFVHAYAKAHAGKDVPAGVHDPEAITGVDARLRMLSRMHVDYVLIVRYTIAFSEKSFRFFLGQLVGKLGMRMLVLGEDARMGANLEGDIKKIRTLAEATGVFELEVVTNQGGTVRVPERFTPTAPNEPGEPGAKCATRAPRTCDTCSARGACRRQTRFSATRTPWKVWWNTARNADEPSASRRRT